jgi:AcrR family transcriptional regulator
MRRDTSTNPRKLPTQDRSKETVEAILQATAIVLKREGYDRASTRRVAQVAGVSVGSLYQYFPNKESLVVALYNRHLRELISMFESRFEESVRAPLPEAVGGLVGASLRLHTLDPELHRVLVEQIPRSARPDPEDALARRVEEMFRAFLEEREAEIRPKNLALAAFMVIEAVEAITHVAVLERPEYLADEDFVEEISALVLSYLSPEEGASDPERTQDART